jgi:hypothetical protein
MLEFGPFDVSGERVQSPSIPPYDTPIAFPQPLTGGAALRAVGPVAFLLAGQGVAIPVYGLAGAYSADDTSVAGAVQPEPRGGGRGINPVGLSGRPGGTSGPGEAARTPSVGAGVNLAGRSGAPPDGGARAAAPASVGGVNATALSEPPGQAPVERQAPGGGTGQGQRPRRSHRSG